MKYATFSLLKGSSLKDSLPKDTAHRLGVLRGDRLIDLRVLVGSRWEGDFPKSLFELIASGPENWARMATRVEEALSGEPPAGAAHSLDKIQLHAPIPRPSKNVICLGLNYASHMEETARARGRQVKIPEVPVFFTKAPTAVSGPSDPIPWDPAVTAEVDYEVELGVVIGKTGKNIPRAKAYEHVFGYTVINDASARDLQQRHYQWFKGKSLDGFCPMGPCLVTADEFGDPHAKRISLRVNGVVKQSASTAEMIFDIPAILEFLSRGMTLEAGDIISTGTPEGVGLGRTPPEYLKDGDLVESEVEGIGVLRNRVVALRQAP
ncbi:MAG: fumarylacetoacetate hydrolase family protein [Acidobacteria bacterium]|nr:fumarylacetoacetate hydrolase family protein [Acidobacteriota bacterium]